MHRDLLLPASILVLAGAVALHAVTPAFAQSPAASATRLAPDVPATLTPMCKAIRIGTTAEVEKVMGQIRETGRDRFVLVGSGMICGWR